MNYSLFFDYDNKKLEQKAYDNILKEFENRETGYYRLPETSKKFLNINFGAEYNEVVVIGIGGSSLGAKAIYSIFKDKLKKMIFLENPDPVDIEDKIKEIKKPLFFVISKSGKTIETISIFKETIKKFDLGKNAKNLKIITDENSPLDKFAKKWNLETFHIPHNVGGRFSVLSAVGTVPLKAAGLNVKNLLEGAKEFREKFFQKKEWHLNKKAAFYAQNYQKYPINVMFAYSNMLSSFKDWFVQLFGESLGKDGKEIMPVGHIGSIDQHSFLQLLMEGMGKKTLTFVKIENFQSKLTIPDINLPYLEATDFVNAHTFNELINKECDSTLEALLSKNYPIDLITISQINEKNTGNLIMYYEILTSAIGSLLGINTYNQPGVELGKQILRNKF
ncbi:glucose-6-phosphate isomerase [Lebetimonas sp. JS032]|uniref:glucose-6-phosphate isomerase n=1 Tax=Lebetimonas sp. JS032 TaxID=990070 RepID=UPI000467D2AE|nr:glucose-6-phosphate isomerase [Lebetimonas sp. JS032]